MHEYSGVTLGGGGDDVVSHWRVCRILAPIRQSPARSSRRYQPASTQARPPRPQARSFQGRPARYRSDSLSQGSVHHVARALTEDRPILTNSPFPRRGITLVTDAPMSRLHRDARWPRPAHRPPVQCQEGNIPSIRRQARHIDNNRVRSPVSRSKTSSAPKLRERPQSADVSRRRRPANDGTTTIIIHRRLSSIRRSVQSCQPDNTRPHSESASWPLKFGQRRRAGN